MDIFGVEDNVEPETPDDLKEKGTIAWTQGNHEEAMGYWAKALKSLMNMATKGFLTTRSRELQLVCHLNLSLGHLHLKNWRKAIHHADMALREEEGNEKALLRKAKALCAMQETSEAKEVLKCLLKNKADHSEALALLCAINKSVKAANKSSRKVYQSMFSVEATVTHTDEKKEEKTCASKEKAHLPVTGADVDTPLLSGEHTDKADVEAPLSNDHQNSHKADVDTPLSSGKHTDKELQLAALSSDSVDFIASHSSNVSVTNMMPPIKWMKEDEDSSVWYTPKTLQYLATHCNIPIRRSFPLTILYAIEMAYKEAQKRQEKEKQMKMKEIAEDAAKDAGSSPKDATLYAAASAAGDSNSLLASDEEKSSEKLPTSGFLEENKEEDMKKLNDLPPLHSESFQLVNLHKLHVGLHVIVGSFKQIVETNMSIILERWPAVKNFIIVFVCVNDTCLHPTLATNSLTKNLSGPRSVENQATKQLLSIHQYAGDYPSFLRECGDSLSNDEMALYPDVCVFDSILLESHYDSMKEALTFIARKSWLCVATLYANAQEESNYATKLKGIVDELKLKVLLPPTMNRFPIIISPPGNEKGRGGEDEEESTQEDSSARTEEFAVENSLVLGGSIFKNGAFTVFKGRIEVNSQ